MFKRNLGWIRNKRDLTSSSTRQLLQNNIGLTIYLEGDYVTFFRRRNVFSDATKIIFSYFLNTCIKISGNNFITYKKKTTNLVIFNADKKFLSKIRSWAVPMGCLLACFQCLSWKYRLNLLRHVVFIKENLFLIQKLFILRLLDTIGSHIAFFLYWWIRSEMLFFLN
jgi:hypothetical protein